MMQPTFAALLMGKITMPAPPRHLVRIVSGDCPHPAWNSELKSAALAEHLNKHNTEQKQMADQHKQSVLDAVIAGHNCRGSIASLLSLSDSCVSKKLTELKDDGLVAFSREGSLYLWRPTGKQLPHSYSTASCHSEASGGDCIQGGEEAVFDGEGE